MTVITKPLSQEKKDEKQQKEVVNINENPTKAIPEDSVVLNSDTRSVCVEIAGHTHVSRRTSRTRNSPSRTLFVTKICLLIPALCSIIMGFSIVLHGLLTIGSGRQMYKGYCRIPYPTTIPGFFGLTDDPFHQFPNSGSKSIGFAARLDGNHQGAIDNEKVYRIVTGDFVNELLDPKMKQEDEKKESEPTSKYIPETKHDSQHENDLSLTKISESLVQKHENKAERNFELDFDIDIAEEREELQMPELSRGKYLHDFKMNKTAIIDHGKKRCFVFDLNRKHISSPRSLFELLHGMIKGTFGINFQQIREDMELKFPAVDNFDEYGTVIKNVCDGMVTYRLVPAHPSKKWKVAIEDGNVDITKERQKKVGMLPTRVKRSAEEENDTPRKDEYLEFAGKYIHYNIVNLNDIE